jgi:hypothetical protein
LRCSIKMRRRNFLPPAFARESEFPQWCAISTLSLERQWHGRKGSWIIYIVALRVQAGDAHLNIAESTAFSRGEKSVLVLAAASLFPAPSAYHSTPKSCLGSRFLSPKESGSADPKKTKTKKPALNIYPQQRRLNHAKPPMPEFMV